MGACQTVQQWITKNVLVPVTELITEAQEKCEEFGEWVEEQVEQPIEQQVSQAQEQCKKWPWPLSWACSVVTVIVTVIVWVVVTVVKWVVKIVCQVVTIVVGIVVSVVLKVLAWLVSFVVCIFTDPIAALVSFRDLWTIVLDTVGQVFDLVDTLLADVEGIFTDIEQLIDTVASLLGWLGVILGILKGIIQLVRDIVSGIRDFLGGVKDFVLGLLSGSLCRAIRGFLDLLVGAVRVGLAVGFGLFPWGVIRVGGAVVGGVRDEVEQHLLEGVIRDSLANAFGSDTERIDRAIKAIAVNARPMGLKFDLDARRMFLDSENPRFNPKTLHDAGVINLYRLAGYWSDCGNLNNEPDSEVVYAGTNLRVTYADLDAYLAGGPGSAPHFRVYAITRKKFRVHLETAKRKAQAIGVRFYFHLGEVEATLPDHVPLNAREADKAAQEALFAAAFGRDATGANLSTIPTVSHFHYIRFEGRELFGLATVFRPAENFQEVSGVTYRNLTPDWGLRFVLAHEIGHYLRLLHEDRAGNDRPLDQIMYSPRNGIKIEWTTPFEYLLLTGEPRFTLDDAHTTWEWITGPTVRDILLP